MAKQPYIPIYTGDYLKDTRILPLNVRGAWVDIMIFMWESKERGVLIATLPEYAMMMSCSLDEANFAISLLQQKGVCDYEIVPSGMIKLISRRMVRDVNLSKTRSEAGKAGAAAKFASTFAKAKPQANSDNDIDNDNEVDTTLKKEPKKVSRETKLEIFEQLFTDELYVEQLSMTHKGKDIKQSFEECYTHHANAPNPPRELWEWKQKLNTWLTIKRNGTTTKKQRNQSDLMQGWAEKYGTGNGAK